MIVMCDVTLCPYNNNNFCAKSNIIKINDNGTCNTIFKKRNMGYIQNNLTREVDTQEPIIIIDAADD